MAMGDDALCALIQCDVVPARPDYLFCEVLGGSPVRETIVQPAVWSVDVNDGVVGPWHRRSRICV